MSEIRDFVEFIVRHLVDIPKEIQVTEKVGEQTTIYELHVAKSDFGKVVGKRGHNAQALRTLIGAVSAKAGKRSFFEIVDKK
jgi:predicted RNA-binding protein YlqC (UPF0109 family)